MQVNAKFDLVRNASFPESLGAYEIHQTNYALISLNRLACRNTDEEITRKVSIMQQLHVLNCISEDLPV